MNLGHVFKLISLVLLLIVYCEFLVYYIVLWHCHWPELASNLEHESILRAFFIADTHLLGSRLGHPWDKLRREWQMHRGYVTAQTLLKPEVTFFLGDLFDEGKWSDNAEFEETVGRFHSLFPGENNAVLVGNHDIGFHYDVTDWKRKRFYGAFGLDPVGIRRLKIKDVDFVLVDSLAMHGDNCEFCAPAMKAVNRMEKELSRRELSRPILLQHFPLYRKSDADCNESNDPDVLSDPQERQVVFEPRKDCLSLNSSRFLLQKLKPRLVMSGHTHHGCKKIHVSDGLNIPEWSVASFSWRNRNNPVIVLATLTSDEFVLNKCFLPEENSVINVYIIGVILILIYAILTRRKFYRRF